MKIIAHRSLSKFAPENSLKAVNLALEEGVGGIEIDVRQTKDKKLVLFHDPTLRRLGGVNRKIDSYNSAELSEIRLKSGEPIAFLSEILDAVDGKTLLVIEGKGKAWATTLKNELKTCSWLDNIRVISFNRLELAKFKQLFPGPKCYIITLLNSYKASSLARQNNFDGVVVHSALLHPFLYNSALKHHLGINVFTLNNAVIARQIHKLYPEADITTDQPLKIKSALS